MPLSNPDKSKWKYVDADGRSSEVSLVEKPNEIEYVKWINEENDDNILIANEHVYMLIHDLLGELHKLTDANVKQGLALTHLEHVHAEYKGSMEGKTCGHCNWQERAICCRDREKLEAIAESHKASLEEVIRVAASSPVDKLILEIANKALASVGAND